MSRVNNALGDILEDVESNLCAHCLCDKPNEGVGFDYLDNPICTECANDPERFIICTDCGKPVQVELFDGNCCPKCREKE